MVLAWGVDAEEFAAVGSPDLVRGWVQLRSGDDRLIFVIVDLPDWLRGSPSENGELPEIEGVSARWFGASYAGDPALGLVVAEQVGDRPRAATWLIPAPPSVCVEAANAAPHIVGLISSDDPGADELLAEEGAPAEVLSRATHVEMRHVADSVTQLYGALAAGLDGSGLPDAGDDEVLAREAARVRARVALARGERVTEDQLLPMAWRPWHYDFVEDHNGLLWAWPTQQIYFGLQHPSRVNVGALGRAPAEAEKTLHGFLATVKRLSRSLAVNAGGAIKIRMTEADGLLPPDVDSPHDDALDAMLTHLRKLLDPNEVSGFSFSRVYKAMAAAAHSAGASGLQDELRRWRDAEKGVRRTQRQALRHELLAELGVWPDEQDVARVPFPGVPQISPEALINVYMYGEALHVHEGKAQLDEWDSDPVLGPLMRQEARSDANALLHFYGAFGTYVQAWLDAGAT